ncbi:hypothetical protein [Falsiroseomonas selenitidurans]|uniref:Flagellar assembly protein FliH n=1 Tax=Falsiroseomonas selenitidurans TaxID=2716335 RepID=A0ABX1EE22_9PROT|nr:hypothetical protein [Falsiroseomonas selenitidurans]NKC33998.1 hypothetical protein [Falsiroseomonas selenitidurans]
MSRPQPALAARRGSYLLALDDFDAPARPATAPPPAPPDPLPGLLAAARAEGFAEGRAAGQAEALRGTEAAAAQALREAASALALAADEARAVAERSATEVARLALATLLAALPSLAERLAEAEVARFATALLPGLQAEPTVALRVAPSLVEVIGARFAQEARVAVVADAALQPGDAALSWRDGQAERRGEAARAAVMETLSGFGLA